MKRILPDTQVLDHKKHREKVKNIKKEVDNNPSHLNVTYYVSNRKYVEQLHSAINLKESNVKLIKHINIIYSTTGRTDSSWDKNKAWPRVQKKETFSKKQKEDIKTANKYHRMKKATIDSLYSKNNLPNPYESMKFLRGNLNRRWSTTDSWSICPHGFKSIPSKRKTCYLEIEVDKWAAGRLEIELYCDIVPVTAQNFLALCESNTEITYAKTTFFRIVPGLFCLGGDVVNNSGTGGCTIDGSSFPDENHILLHNGPGVVSMYKREPNKNDSQFLITFRKLSSLDEKYVVIGRTKSMRVLGIIEEFGTSSGKPKRRVNVVKCGVV